MQQRKHICTRCQKGFRTAHAKQQRILDSPNHWVCHECSSPLDYSTEEELNEHLEHDHHICTTCDRKFSASRQLFQHDIDKHNMCALCRRYFNNPSNLKSHKISHAKRNIGCPGCSRRFPTNSAMMLHLEAGTCDSGVDVDMINQLAFECYEALQYKSSNANFNFECPTCQTPFAYMSGILQHAESDICEVGLDSISPLRIFLEFARSSIECESSDS
ncbi:putative C2H2 finger domain protein [Aspergillus saccharolyticus JOP 1030-1]|uniref:C2H2-type domain-containing protein n=1 Tax=Aspergillus saccharolyticus JOP 1030-1 TaxID=1450539 RepID=A0A318YZM6_9EURO|nr:hypothetical protein BP01DRAFT_309113 [Aspergillus saccharolyticus JOP 1030-1]PYH40069.1 hypothetical protein BP01DRAFT_309113 [Aspergillus saccharolyticus JOP 1030-1]